MNIEFERNRFAVFWRQGSSALVLVSLIACPIHAATSVVCGEPIYDKSIDSAVFLWNTCGSGKWNVRVTAGGKNLRYQGSLTTDRPFVRLAGFSIEAGDTLSPAGFQVPTAGPIAFDFYVGAAGVDGMNFTVSAQSQVCFNLSAPSDLPVFAGAGRLPVASSVRLSDFQPCGGGAYRLIVDDVVATENGGFAEFNVSLSPAPAAGKSVVVNYATVDGTAQSGSDYTAVSGSFIFSADKTLHTVQVPLTNDADRESREVLSLELTSADAATKIATAAINDDDDGQPNIVVILTDDQRWDTLWSMPSIEALASGGVKFNNAFVSTPLCGPVRANILSGGFRAGNTGIINNIQAMAPLATFNDRDTIALRLQQSGYQTFFTGKYINGYGTMAGYVPPGWTRWVANNGGPEQQIWNNFNVTIGATADQPGTGKVVGPITTYVSDYHRDAVLSFLDSVGGKPFFVFWSAFAPHSPATASPEDAGVFADYLYRDRAWDEIDLSDKPNWVSNPAMVPHSKQPNDDFHRQQLVSLQAVGRGVEAIVNKVAELGLADKTIFFFLGDNGFLWGEHGLSGKGMAYEESVRVPFVAFGAGISPKIENRLVLADLDLGPTLLDIAGVAAGPSDGTSLWPLLRGSNPTWRDDLLFEHWGEWAFGPHETWAALRTTRWKYILQADGSDELYDLSVDPYEEQSLHENPAFDTVRENFATQLAARKSLALNAPVTPVGFKGKPYKFTLAAWGGSGDYRWSIESGVLPPGLSLNSQTGIIDGVPTAFGVWPIRIRVEDGTLGTHSGLPRHHSHLYTFRFK